MEEQSILPSFFSSPILYKGPAPPPHSSLCPILSHHFTYWGSGHPAWIGDKAIHR